MRDLKGYNSDEERDLGNKEIVDILPDNQVENDNSAGVMFKSRSSIHQKINPI